MKKIYTVVFAISIVSTSLFANVKGRVFSLSESQKEEALMAADVFWLGSSIRTTTDANGDFEIPYNDKHKQLVVAFYGYQSDTLTVLDNRKELKIRLQSQSNELDAVRISAGQKGTSISKINPVTTEIISYAGLCKMACCNLAESFENSGTITVGYSDAVSGARQIRMLGLAGSYTQMLDEARPTLRGIASTYALNYTPGMWLESIQVSKGTSSVAQGYEGIAGQINVEHRKPTSDDRLFVNTYFNSELRSELNVAATLKPSKNTSGIILVHGSLDALQHDRNKDNFIDMPQSKQINVATRWLTSFDNGVQLRTGLRFLAEERNGGQKMHPTASYSSLPKYTTYSLNQHANAYVKLGVPFGSYEQHSFAILTDYSVHEQKSFYGTRHYNAQQHSGFVNALLQMQFLDKHKAIFGLNTRGDFYKEDFFIENQILENSHLLLHQNEFEAGAFGEYTFTLDERFNAIFGARVDQNNLYGTLLTPRVHLKYNIAKTLVARVSAGRGFRSPNVLADNLWMLANQREITINERPKMEDAWTLGLSLTQYFRWNDEEKASISFDVFRTSFTNQLIVDQELSGNKIGIYNLQGASFANNYQLDINVEPLPRFNIFATFRYSDTKVQLQEMGLVRKPLVETFKGLLNLSYATKFSKWMFDFTAQINGQSRLPSSTFVNYDYDIADGYSPIYPMFFAQVTRKFRKIDVYLGCENIGNYIQKNPIISANNPWDEDFNASIIYAPLMGRKFYAGIRWTIF
ncbi:MAG: TonB-dependent receptor [Bacteroidales bacterium]